MPLGSVLKYDQFEDTFKYTLIRMRHAMRQNDQIINCCCSINNRTFVMDFIQ